MTQFYLSDPDNVFIVDPIASIIPPKESRLFTVRFRFELNNYLDITNNRNISR